MEIVFAQLVEQLQALWWPFCRVLAMFSAAPALGEHTVPVRVRVLVSVVLAVVLLPMSQPLVAIDPFSMRGVLATVEQVAIGFVIGLAFHLTVAVMLVLGYVVSSQMALSMAVMNDPMNGNSSDVVSSLLSILCILVFFGIDGHLVLTGVVGASLKVWPVGTGLASISLETLALNVAWVFAAAMLLALPIVFSMFVVQIGFGFLNRVAPALNLFSLGFSVITLFGLLMLSYVVRFVPDHYVRMTGRVLDALHQQMAQGR